MAEVSVLLTDQLRELALRCRRHTGYRPQNTPSDLEGLRGALQGPPSEDFHQLCELRRPDLTVEAFILSLADRERLFSSHELCIARARLADAEELVRGKRVAER